MGKTARSASRHTKDDGRRCPIADARAVAGKVIEAIRPHVEGGLITVAGSLRRCRPEVGDVDILAVVPPAEVPLVFAALNGLGGELVGGGASRVYAGIDGLHVDVVFTTAASWGAALMHCTGSKETNIIQRARANAVGLTLNEYGLWQPVPSTETRVNRLGKVVPVPAQAKLVAGATEEEVYRALGLDFMPPERR